MIAFYWKNQIHVEAVLNEEQSRIGPYRFYCKSNPIFLKSFQQILDFYQVTVTLNQYHYRKREVLIDFSIENLFQG